MYEVNYNGRTLYVSNYFYCRIRSGGLLYDAERDLLAIAKFYVALCNAIVSETVQNTTSHYSSLIGNRMRRFDRHQTC